MSVSFSADDALSIAVKIEENGSEFYRVAGDKVSDGECTDLLLQLAHWELTHVEKFAEMKSDLTDEERKPTAYDPDNESALFLAALADRSVFEVSEDPLAALGESPSMEAILEEAIVREKESIVFYVGLREVVPERLGKDKIDAIIKEEMSHITMLNRQFRRLK